MRFSFTALFIRTDSEESESNCASVSQSSLCSFACSDLQATLKRHKRVLSALNQSISLQLSAKRSIRFATWISDSVSHSLLWLDS